MGTATADGTGLHGTGKPCTHCTACLVVLLLVVQVLVVLVLYCTDSCTTSNTDF
jgi:hypothetical protein